MDYRERIYSKYTTQKTGQAQPLSREEADRWGAPYDVYLRGWLPRNKAAAIVDVACGDGRLLRFLSKRGYTNVTGVDISSEQVWLARHLHPQVECANALDYLGKHQGQFDLIVAFDVLEHFTKDEVLCFLDACYGALRPEGRVIIQTLNAESPWVVVPRYSDFTHELCFTVRSLKSLARLTGFSSCSAREEAPVPHGVLSAGRWLLWKAIRLQYQFLNMVEIGSAGQVFTRVFIASAVRGGSGIGGAAQSVNPGACEPGGA